MRKEVDNGDGGGGGGDVCVCNSYSEDAAKQHPLGR